MTDRELVGKAANLNDDQITELAKLKTGVCAVYQNNWIEPVLCHVDPWNEKMNKPSKEKHEELVDATEVKKQIDVLVKEVINNHNKITVDLINGKLKVNSY